MLCMVRVMPDGEGMGGGAREHERSGRSLVLLHA